MYTNKKNNQRIVEILYMKFYTLQVNNQWKMIVKYHVENTSIEITKEENIKSGKFCMTFFLVAD